MAYNRKYKVVVTPLKKAGLSVIQSGPAITIQDPITMRFNVSREFWAGNCTATIDLYNLDPETRNKMFLDYFSTENVGGLRRVELYAGYQQDKYGLIYRGFVKTCLNRKERTDNITTIEALSGLYVLDSFVSLSTGKIETEESISKTISSQMTGISNGVQEFANRQTTRPTALLGNEIALLKTYTNGNAIIDNNELIILPESKSTKGLVRVIDDETGLLGIPQRMDRSVKVRCMLEPRIEIGQGIEISSRIEPTFNGQYKVWGIEHSGTMGIASAGECVTTITLWTGYQLFGRFKSSLNKLKGLAQNVQI